MYERLLDKNNRPALDELIAHCGVNGENYKLFNAYLADRFNTIQEIRFPYGNKYGWCITHRKGKKYICDVFAEAGAFTVMVRLTDIQFEEVYETITEYGKNYINNKYPCSDGGWIHYRVTDAVYLEDIKKILKTKCS